MYIYILSTQFRLLLIYMHKLFTKPKNKKLKKKINLFFVIVIKEQVFWNLAVFVFWNETFLPCLFCASMNVIFHLILWILLDCQGHLRQVCCHGGSHGKITHEQEEGHSSQDLETPIFPSYGRLVVLLWGTGSSHCYSQSKSSAVERYNRNWSCSFLLNFSCSCRNVLPGYSPTQSWSVLMLFGSQCSENKNPSNAKFIPPL